MTTIRSTIAKRTRAMCVILPNPKTSLMLTMFSTKVPNKYATYSYTMPDGSTRTGVAGCLAATFEPFKDKLVKNWDDGWACLMKYDALSTRAYLLTEMKFPLSVVRWMETRDTSTGAYDLAFSEVNTLSPSLRKMLTMAVVRPRLPGLRLPKWHPHHTKGRGRRNKMVLHRRRHRRTN
jgi:hypothetical protein